MPAEKHLIHVSADYSAVGTGCAELSQPWENVEAWGVKWDTLHITYKDGTEESLDLLSSYDTETKRPSAASIIADDGTGMPDWGNELDQF